MSQINSAYAAERDSLLALKLLVTELRWQLALRRFVRKYSPDQPRDERGRWTDGGGADNDPTDLSAARRPSRALLARCTAQYALDAIVCARARSRACYEHY